MTRQEITDVLERGLSMTIWTLNSKAEANGITNIGELVEWVYETVQPPQIDDYEDGYDYSEALRDWYQNEGR